MSGILVARTRIKNTSADLSFFRTPIKQYKDIFQRGGRIKRRDGTAFQIIQTTLHSTRINFRGGPSRKHSFLYPKYYSPSLSNHHHQPQCHHQRQHRLFATVNSPTNSTALTDILTKQEQEEEAIYQELKSLSSLLLQHDTSYYSPNTTTSSTAATTTTTIISDDEYDALASREAYICTTYPHLLKKLETESKLGKRATRFGGRVGFVLASENKDRKKRWHLENKPMKSLDNALNTEEVSSWLERISKLLPEKKEERVEILGEPKLDGLSLSLRYILNHNKESYEFEWGATRGDGTKGEDVTDAVLDMVNSHIPQIIPIDKNNKEKMPEILEVRGEVILPKSSFQQLQQQQQQQQQQVQQQKKNGTNETEITQYQYSNARNAASGILLRKSSSNNMKEEENQETKKLRSKLLFYAYDVVTSFPDNDDAMLNLGTKNGVIKSGLEMRDALQKMGFLVSSPTVVASPSLVIEENEEEELKKLLNYHSALSSLRESEENSAPNNPFPEIDYDIDGAVYKLTSLSLRSTLGSSTRSPKWSIAHKFPPKCGITTLQDVIIQVGRKTGALTPVAVLKPVSIGGVVVSRASLHNFDWAGNVLSSSKEEEEEDGGEEEDVEQQRGKKWGRVKRNATVVVSRAGDVIPQVLSLVEDYDKINDDQNNVDDDGDDEWISLIPPKTCPACNHTTIFETSSSKDDNDGDSSGGRILRCGGPQLLCPPRAVGALIHAYSRDALDVKGLSEARIEQLMDAGFVTFPCDLFYSLVEDERNDEMEGNGNGEDKDTATNTKIKEIAELPGWGPKSSQNLADMVQSVATSGVPLSKYIYSLGIRHVGTHTSKLMSSSYGTVSEFLNDLEGVNKNRDEEDYVPFVRLVSSENNEEDGGVKGIGPVMIKSLLAFSQEDALVKAAKDLAKVIRVHDDTTAKKRTNQMPKKNAEKRLWDGFTVVFTGALPGGMTRSEAQDVAMEVLGAKSTPGSVSKSTDLVVEGDKGGKKVDKAIELGVRVISGDEFIRLVEEWRS